MPPDDRSPWVARSFSILYAIPSRNGVSYPSRRRGEGIPMVNMRELFAFDVIRNQFMERVPLTPSECERFVLNEGDLLFARQSLVREGAGRVVLVGRADEPRTWDSHLIRVRLDPVRADPHFYFYYFRSPAGRRSIDSIIEQVAAAGIRGSDLGNLVVPVPEISRQQAIAEVLRALDDKIQANRNAVTTAEELASTSVTAGIQITTLGVVAVINRKLVSTASFAGRDVEHFSIAAFDVNQMPVVESGDRIKSGKFLLESASVLVSKLNPHIRRVWMAEPTGTKPAITSTEFIALLPAADYPVEALWAVCSSPAFSSQLVEMVKGTTGSHQRVAPEDVLTVNIPDPRTLGQRAIEAITAEVQATVVLRRESACLASLRDALLPRLFSGEVRVREAEDLVAEVV